MSAVSCKEFAATYIMCGYFAAEKSEFATIDYM